MAVSSHALIGENTALSSFGRVNVNGPSTSTAGIERSCYSARNKHPSAAFKGSTQKHVLPSVPALRAPQPEQLHRICQALGTSAAHGSCLGSWTEVIHQIQGARLAKHRPEGGAAVAAGTRAVLRLRQIQVTAPGAGLPQTDAGLPGRMEEQQRYSLAPARNLFT